MVIASAQPRCGSPVTGAGCCPGSRHQDGHLIPNHPTLRVARVWSTRTLRLAATPLMENGSSPTLCLRSGLAMCPGRVQLGYSSWEETTGGPPALRSHLSCSPPPTTPQLLASVCHIRPSNSCVDNHYTVHIYIVIIFIFSDACAIELEDRVVVTGGWDDNNDEAISTVQEYTLSGPQYPKLPSLQTPRYHHACAHYMDSQERVVSIYNVTSQLICSPYSHYGVVMINDNN